VSQATTPGPQETRADSFLPLPKLPRKASPPTLDSLPENPNVPIERPRRPTSAAERQQAREVARFVHACAAGGQPLLVTLALIAKHFPGITLDTTLAGYVFRSLLAPAPTGATTTH
jgi:hypothetical protein